MNKIIKSFLSLTVIASSIYSAHSVKIKITKPATRAEISNILIKNNRMNSGCVYINNCQVYIPQNMDIAAVALAINQQLSAPSMPIKAKAFYQNEALTLQSEEYGSEAVLCLIDPYDILELSNQDKLCCKTVVVMGEDVAVVKCVQDIQMSSQTAALFIQGNGLMAMNNCNECIQVKEQDNYQYTICDLGVEQVKNNSFIAKNRSPLLIRYPSVHGIELKENFINAILEANPTQNIIFVEMDVMVCPKSPEFNIEFQQGFPLPQATQLVINGVNCDISGCNYPYEVVQKIIELEQQTNVSVINDSFLVCAGVGANTCLSIQDSQCILSSQPQVCIKGLDAIGVLLICGKKYYFQKGNQYCLEDEQGNKIFLDPKNIPVKKCIVAVISRYN